MKIFFDVGAELGLTTIPLAKANPDTLFYAIEPNPHMVAHLKKESAGLENYLIFQYAASNFTGKAKFNVCTEHPGICSLLEFKKDAKKNWNAPNFPIFTDEVYEVDVICLEDFIAEHKIEHIDYFHCDAQGSDLNVLKGLGDKIHIIKEGQVESEYLKDSLYVNQNTYGDTAKFLAEKGFEIVKVDSEGGFRECNIKFRKTALTFSI